MIYNLVNKNDPILKTECNQFDFKNPQTDLEDLIKSLAETMIYHGGIGLAAPQIGVPLSIFVAGSAQDPENILAFINPKVVDIDEKLEYIIEGCLSFPNLFVKVKRPVGVRLRFANTIGDITTQKFTGMTARIILHEYDHLRGITFNKVANKIHLEQAKNKAKRLVRLEKKAIANVQERAL